MLRLRLIFKIILIFLFSAAKANYFGNYLDTIASKCGDVNSLVVKKSLIFLLKDAKNQCDDSFTKKILKECPAIGDCASLHLILDRVSSKNSGNIIGVTKD